MPVSFLHCSSIKKFFEPASALPVGDALSCCSLVELGVAFLSKLCSLSCRFFDPIFFKIGLLIIRKVMAFLLHRF